MVKYSAGSIIAAVIIILAGVVVLFFGLLEIYKMFGYPGLAISAIIGLLLSGQRR